MTLVNRPLMFMTATVPETWARPSGVIVTPSPGRSCVGAVFANRGLQGLRRGNVNPAVGINPAKAFGQFGRISGLEQQPVEAYARVALRILRDELFEVIRNLHLREARRVEKRLDFNPRDFLGQCVLFLAQPL